MRKLIVGAGLLATTMLGYSTLPSDAQDTTAKESTASSEARRWGLISGEPQITLLQDENGKALFLEYQKVGDLAVFEGDIVLGQHEDLQISLASGMTVINSDTLQQALSKFPQLATQTKNVNDSLTIPFGNGVRPLVKLWPQRTIPYGIAPDMVGVKRSEVEAAVKLWNVTGAVKLVSLDKVSPRVSSTIGHIWIRPISQPTVCQSGLGRGTDKRTVIDIGSYCTTGTVVHEIGHALGLGHEQLRRDRDQYINVDLSNVTDSGKDQIDYCHWRSGGTLCEGIYRDLGDYDLCSIMHYPPILPRQGAWLVDPDGNDTIFKLNSQGQTKLVNCGAEFQDVHCRVLGQTCGPSLGDIDAIKTLYREIAWEIK